MCRSQLPSCLKMRRPWYSQLVKTARLPGKKKQVIQQMVWKVPGGAVWDRPSSVLFLRGVYKAENTLRALVSVPPTSHPVLLKWFVLRGFLSYRHGLSTCGLCLRSNLSTILATVLRNSYSGEYLTFLTVLFTFLPFMTAMCLLMEREYWSF